MGGLYPRHSQNPIEIIHSPEKYEGLRQRFRNRINKSTSIKFKYHTCLTRAKQLRVELRRGDLDEFTRVVEVAFPTGRHEGFPIYVVALYLPGGFFEEIVQ